MKLNYENLEVWKLSRELIKKIYVLTAKFPKSEDFALTSQVRRAVVSISLNIAEGSARGSKKDFNRFLDISIGSTVEVRTCLTIAVDLGYLKNEDLYQAENDLEKMYFKLFGLKKSLNILNDSNASNVSNNHNEVSL